MKFSSRSLQLTLIALCVFSVASFCQIRDIKLHSSGVRLGGEGRGGGGYGSALYFLAETMANTLINWQVSRLGKKAEDPSIVSLEMMMQIASQPSRYYIVNPRVRGNWGIFFTDFRTNYMFEQVPGGIIDMRTDDWQILGLNVVQLAGFNLRISTGLMYERFGSNNRFNESVVGTQWRSPQGRYGWMGEYRWTERFDTGERPRTEINASILRTIKSPQHFDFSLSVGGVYQTYYSEVPVWGLQGGIVARVY